MNDQSGNHVTSNEPFIPPAPGGIKVFSESARPRKRRLEWKARNEILKKQLKYLLVELKILLFVKAVMESI